jgi:hypothetical protein
MNGRFLLFGGDQIENIFKRLVDRQIRKQRREERRLAEEHSTKHQFEARRSCVADARSYRIAKGFPVSAAAQLDWKALIPAGRPSKFR